MPFLFQSDARSPETQNAGFIVAKRQIAYGPGVIILTTLFGLSLLAYAGLYSWRMKVAGEILAVQGSIDILERSRDKKKESEILAFERRVSALSKVLRSHYRLSKIFPLVQALTLPNTYYDSVGITIGNQGKNPADSQPNAEVVNVRLTGTVVSLKDLARQMVVLREDPSLQKGSIDSFTLPSAGGLQDVKFTATLIFDRKAILGLSTPSSTP